MIDPADSLRFGAALAVALAAIGFTVAWLPAIRFGGGAVLMSRVLITAGLLAIILDARGLGSVLGIALLAMGFAIMWQGLPEPEVPRPRRKGVLIAAAISALAVVAVIRGWWHLERIPEQATSSAVVVVALLGTLGTLAIADRSRIKLRDAVRERLYIRRI